MRLSELMGAEVLDEAGRRVGIVHDVRLVQDGPVLGAWGAAFRVDGLVTTPRRAGSYFGYDRGSVRGPALVRRFFEWLHRGSVLVPWAQVTEVGEGTIRMRGQPAALERL